MNSLSNHTTLKNQKGVTLIITFFVMIIILAVVLSISVLLYSGVRVIRDVGNSVVSFYVADSGVEKFLYYDRQVLPLLAPPGDSCGSDLDCTSPYVCDDGTCKNLAKRGLCSMNTYDPSYNPYPCGPKNGVASDDSAYCTGATLTPAAGHADGCNTNVCNNCTISFNTTFDNSTYTVTAVVNSTNYLDVSSWGTYIGSGTGRKIELITQQEYSDDANTTNGTDDTTASGFGPVITNAQAIIKMGNNGGKITVSADVTGPDGIVGVTASIFSDGPTETFDLTSQGDGNYSHPWNDAQPGVSYSVSITATDTAGHTKTVNGIIPSDSGPDITNAEAILTPVGDGVQIYVSANVTDPDGVINVTASVTSDGSSEYFDLIDKGVDGIYSGSWPNAQVGINYTISITATDGSGKTTTMDNIPFGSL